jgi:hypothetical protein
MFKFIKSLNENKDISKSLQKTLNISAKDSENVVKNLSVGLEIELIDIIDDAKKVKEFFDIHHIKIPNSINTSNKDGENKMSKNKIDENLQSIPSIARLRDLAGIRSPIDEDIADVEDNQIQDIENFDDFDNDFENTDAVIGGYVPRRMRDLPIKEPIAPVANASTDAFNEIQNHINTITTLMMDIRISDYKPLLGQLETLVAELRGRGLDALRESSENRIQLKKKV